MNSVYIILPLSVFVCVFVFPGLDGGKSVWGIKWYDWVILPEKSFLFSFLTIQAPRTPFDVHFNQKVGKHGLEWVKWSLNRYSKPTAKIKYWFLKTMMLELLWGPTLVLNIKSQKVWETQSMDLSCERICGGIRTVSTARQRMK